MADNLTITARDGQVFEIDKSDPNFDKLCTFANDTATRNNLKKIGIIDTNKQLEAYLKYKRPENDYMKPLPVLTECERMDLEQKPSYNGRGIGLRGEKLQEALQKFHRIE